MKIRYSTLQNRLQNLGNYTQPTAKRFANVLMRSTKNSKCSSVGEKKKKTISWNRIVRTVTSHAISIVLSLAATTTATFPVDDRRFFRARELRGGGFIDPGATAGTGYSLQVHPGAANQTAARLLDPFRSRRRSFRPLAAVGAAVASRAPRRSTKSRAPELCSPCGKEPCGSAHRWSSRLSRFLDTPPIPDTLPLRRRPFRPPKWHKAFSSTPPFTRRIFLFLFFEEKTTMLPPLVARRGFGGKPRSRREKLLENWTRRRVKN